MRSEMGQMPTAPLLPKCVSSHLVRRTFSFDCLCKAYWPRRQIGAGPCRRERYTSSHGYPAGRYIAAGQHDD